MMQIATITDKRQLTIPASIFKKLNLKEGQKVIIRSLNDSFEVKSAMTLVNELAGSLEMPDKFKGLSMEEIISQSKKEYMARWPKKP